MRSTKVDGSDADRNADGPPTPATANGTATAKPDEHDDELQRVDPRRAEQSAGREVDRHDAAADQRADPARRAGEDVDDRSAGDELRGKNPETAEARRDP